MGIFNFHPIGKQTLVCGLGDNQSKIQINPGSVNFKEEEREKILYSERNWRSRFLSNVFSPVDAEFGAVIFGDSPEDVFTNFELLRAALQNEEGGYIEYRPNGFDSAISTFYRYYKSPVPKAPTVVFNKVLLELMNQTNRSSLYSINVVFKVRIDPIATSSPFSLYTIVNSTSLQNSGSANYLSFTPQTRGIGIIPVFEITNTSGSGNDIRGFIIHKRKTNVVATPLDWLEAETFTGMMNESDSSASGGYCKRAEAGEIISSFPTGMDISYFGNVTPVIIARSTAGSQYNLTLQILSGNVVIKSLQPVRVSSSSWGTYFSFENVVIPPFPIIDRYSENTTPKIGQYMLGNLSLKIIAEKVSGDSSYIFIDAIMLLKNEDWLGFFYNNSPYYGKLLGTGANKFILDAFTNNVYIEQSSSINSVWYYRSSPLVDLIFERGYTHYLRFVALTSPDGTFTANRSFSVKINGLYATIYPFTN